MTLTEITDQIFSIRKLLGDELEYETIELRTGLDQILRETYQKLKSPKYNVYYDALTDSIKVEKNV